MLRWLTILMLLASPALAQAPAAPLTWAQVADDSGTEATRPLVNWGPGGPNYPNPSRTPCALNTFPYGVPAGFSWSCGGDEYLGDPTRWGNTGSYAGVSHTADCLVTKGFNCTSMTMFHLITVEATDKSDTVAKPTVAGTNVWYQKYQAWCHLASGGWNLIQDTAVSGLVTGKWAGDETSAIAIPVTNHGGGVFSEAAPPVAPLPGFLNHGYPGSRGNYGLNTVDGCFTYFEARVDQPNDHHLFACGQDWYQNNGASAPGGNTGYTQSRWKPLTTDWQSVVCSALPLELLMADPPPPLQSIAPPPPLGTATISSCLPAVTVCLPWTPANLSPAPKYTFDPSTFTYSGSNFVLGPNTGSVGGNWTAESGTPVKGANLNGWPTINLDGTVGFINTTAAWPVGNVFIFAVVAVPTTQSNSLVSASWGVTEGRDATHDWVFYPRGGSAFGGGANEAWLFQGTTAAVITRGTIIADTAYHIIVIKVGTSADLQNNGSAVTPTTIAGAINTATSTSVRIGASGPGPSEALTGTLAYLTVLVDPTTLNIQKLTGWAAWHFGEQAFLPGGYPYKPAPPCQ